MRFYPNIQVKIGRFGKDSTDLKFHEIIEGNLIHLLHEVQRMLDYKFLIRPITFEGFQRLENKLYPPAALREMLLNALVHRTYMGATIQMRVFENRLSLWNEGVLPTGMSLRDLKIEHNSRPRNPIIANVCFLGGYIDTWGRGTLKIIQSCLDAGLATPEIEEKNGGVEVTLFASIEELKEDKVGDRVGDKVGDRVGDRLSDNQKKIITIISENPYASAKEMALSVGISQRKIETNLSKLKKLSLIQRIGSPKKGYWEVIEEQE